MHPDPSSKRRSYGWLFASIVPIGIFILLVFSVPNSAAARRASPKAVDLANIRSLGQASLIYASDHNEQLPHASDIWDYMRQLAESGNLTDADILWSRLDHAVDLAHRSSIPILEPEISGKPRQLNPAFRQLKPSVAVVLAEINTKMPDTTPITWTRGLQTNGTWSKFSPYGTQGGYIAFMAGNVNFFSDLNAKGGQLTRFDGKGKTANILEALPPGSRIGEYEPTAEEKIAWSRAIDRQQEIPIETWIVLFTGILVILMIFYWLGKTKRRILKILFWLAFILLLGAVLFPAIG